MGQKFKPELRFFGQVIDGDIDLGEDGLPRIGIGSQTTAVVLRSRPVFNVLAHLSFQLEKISTQSMHCEVNTDENVSMLNLTSCFEMVETTKTKAGTTKTELNISVTLDVEQTYQGFFSPTDRNATSLTFTQELRNKDTCFQYPIYMPKCVKHTSPITIRLHLFQVDSDNASAVLNVDSKRQTVEVPF